MTTLVDGLGFEELGDASDSAEKPSQLNITGSVTSASQISGLNVFAAGSGTFGRIGNANGAIFSSIYGATTPGSPGTYGVTVQAGRAGPLITTTGSIIFPIAFTNRNYVVAISPESPTADGIGSTVPYISSGITHATSGCTINAGSGYVYNWIAVGL